MSVTVDKHVLLDSAGTLLATSSGWWWPRYPRRPRPPVDAGDHAQLRGECLVAISGKAFGSWRRGDAPLDCARQGVGVQSQDCEDRAANGARAPGPGGRVLRLSAVSDACSVDWSSTGISWQVRPRSASGGFCAGQEQQTYCGGEGVGAANTGG
jgi:hypothetical protein